MDIVEFLNARYDEDEDLARDLLMGHPGPWRVDSPSGVRDSGGKVVVADEYHWTPMQHIARHDPARVLADIAAKRAIIAAYVQAKADFDQAAPHARQVSAFGGGILTGRLAGLREAVTLLATSLGIEVGRD